MILEQHKVSYHPAVRQLVWNQKRLSQDQMMSKMHIMDKVRLNHNKGQDKQFLSLEHCLGQFLAQKITKAVPNFLSGEENVFSHIWQVDGSLGSTGCTRMCTHQYLHF